MRARLALALLLGGAVSAWLLQREGDDRNSPIRGVVLGPAGAEAGTRVRAQATAITTLTDGDGNFTLPPTAAGRRMTAWKDGFLIAGLRNDRPHLQLTLRPLPGRDHEDYDWVDPRPGSQTHACGNCHGELYREWAASAHARSASGRHFRNLYEGSDWEGRPGVSWGLLDQHPLGGGVCAACHAPAAREPGAEVRDLRALSGTAQLGVHCDYCHKVAGPGSGTIGLTHGRHGLRLLRPAADRQLFFGPLDDVDRGEDSYSAFYHDSRYCASCHEGIVFGIHAYSTYSEWLDSPARRAGRQCQDCHMRPTGQMTNLAPGHGGIERAPHTLANHRFFDGSVEEMLRQAVGVTMDCHKEADDIRARLYVRAEGAGHRVPAGLPDRHLILTLQVTDDTGAPVKPLDGPTLPAAAGPELSGQSGRLYAKLLSDFDGRSPVPFWAAAPGATDNRLTPGRPDVVELSLPGTAARLRVRLLYRRFWDEVVRAKRWPDRDLVVLDRTFPVHP